jgi:hypothetical protein
MWTDNETTVDLLGFRVHADLIRSVVTDENLIPVVIGVFGDWGGGKSSIMKMLQEDFSNKEEYENVVCLYFNGWMFEGYEDAKTALLSSILIQLGEHKKFGKKLREGSAKLLKKVNWMSALKTTLKMGLKYGPLAYSLVTGDVSPHAVPPVSLTLPSAEPAPEEKAAEDGDEKSKSEEKEEKVDWNKLVNEDKSQPDVLGIRKFRDDFEQMLKDTKIESLVILIDDLDRCLPERIIETLEAIKLFVLVPKTAFVIGADQRIVEHAIGTRYVKQHTERQDLSSVDVGQLTKDYLEKLIQIPYNLPRLSPAEIETYINLLACQKFLDEDPLNKVLEDWSSKRKGNFYSAYQYRSVCDLFGEENVIDQLKKQLLWSNSIAQVLTEGLKGNPRQVKRMLNKMILRKKLAEVADIDIDDAILAKLMVLEYIDETHFKDLNTWQTVENGKPKKLAKLEDNILGEEGANKITDEDGLKEWTTGSLKKWLEMKPSLKNIDLRDYFWLARDRTNSTLSGVNMVSSIVKRLFEKLLTGNPGEIKLALQEIKKFNDIEMTALFGLLKEQLERHPDQLNGFDAITRMAREQIAGAGAAFFGTIKKLPASVIPPGVAERTKQAGESDPTLKSDAQSTLKHFAEKFPQTRFGKACQAALDD